MNKFNKFDQVRYNPESSSYTTKWTDGIIMDIYNNNPVEYLVYVDTGKQIVEYEDNLLPVYNAGIEHD